MNIIIITSSPNKNSSFTLRIAKTLAKRMGCETPEIIDLFTINFIHCIDCMKCMEIEKCIIDDDVRLVVDKIKNADVFIIATPVYLFSVNSRLKEFIERTVLWSYKELSGKIGIAVTTANGFGNKETSLYIRKYFSFGGFLYAGSLNCFIYEFKTYKKENSKFNRQIERIIKNYNKIIKSGYRLSFLDYKLFELRKFKLTGGSKRYPVEYRKWREDGWFKRYYFPIKGFKIKNNLTLKIFTYFYKLLFIKKIH